MARFLLLSNSRSEDLLVKGRAVGNTMTFVVEVALRVPQKVEPPVSAGSNILGVELPKAKTMWDLSFFFRASILASLSWFLRKIASRLSLSASHIKRFLSSTWIRLKQYYQILHFKDMYNENQKTFQKVICYLKNQFFSLWNYITFGPFV